MAISLYPLATAKITTGGQAVVAANGPLAGGVITNPSTAAEQGILSAEPLFLDVTGAVAALEETATTFALQPGASFEIIPGQTTNVSVNAATSGHLFNGYVAQPRTQYPPTPQSGTFPPPAPTTVTQIIPSKLYQQYADDDDLQAFISSWNTLAQIYCSWFANVPLAVYTSPQITGTLLDWVALGLYGFARPSLSSGRNRDLGAYGTYAYGTLAYGMRKVVGPSNVTVTSDDVFKRIITWNFYKGDGNVFNARWLKRRIMRFLTGPNGTAPNIDQTYPVSVSFGPGIVSIQINAGTRKTIKGPYGTASFGVLPYGANTSQFTPGAVQYPLAPVLQEAIQSGVLQFPFQLSVTIAI